MNASRRDCMRVRLTVRIEGGEIGRAAPEAGVKKELPFHFAPSFRSRQGITSQPTAHEKMPRIESEERNGHANNHEEKELALDRNRVMFQPAHHANARLGAPGKTIRCRARILSRL